MTFQEQNSTNLPKVNVQATLTISNDVNVLIPALEKLSFSYGFFLTPGKFHQEQNARHQLTCIKSQLEEGNNKLRDLAKKYPEKIDFSQIEKKLQTATERGLLSWGEFSEKIKEDQRKTLETEHRNQSTLKTIWKNALLACGHTVEAADNLFVGGARTLAGSITSFKNPLEVASDVGAKHILDNQRYYNTLWGSVYGTESDFAKMDLYQAMMSSNYIAHFGSAVISPLIETTNLAYDFYCIKVIGGDLSYQQFKKLQQEDPYLRWGKNAFHIAEIAFSLAAIGKIHGATSLKDLTAPLKVGSIFGGVGALGNELCAEDGMSFGRFVDSFLEQMAGSLFCNFILSAAASRYSSFKLGKHQKFTAQNLQKLKAPQIEKIVKVKTQAQQSTTALDFIDAQNDLKEASVEFVKEVLKHNWTWQTVTELEWKDSKKLLGRALLTGLSTFDAFDHNSATPKTKAQNRGLHYENVELNGIKGQLRISKNNKAVFVKNSPELFQEIIRLDLEQRLQEEGKFSTEQIKAWALEKAKAANSYTDRFGRIITQAIDIKNDSRDARITKASKIHHEHQHLLQLDLPETSAWEKEFVAYSKQDDFVQKATDGETALDFATGNVVPASERRESRDQLIARHLEHTLVGNTFLALSERNSAVAEFLQEVGEYILAIEQGKFKELREAKRKTHNKEISEAVVQHFWSQGQLGFAEQAFRLFHLTFADIKSSDVFKRFSRLLDHKNNLLKSSWAFLKENCQIEGEDLSAAIGLAKKYVSDDPELIRQIKYIINIIETIQKLFHLETKYDPKLFKYSSSHKLGIQIIANSKITCAGKWFEEKYTELFDLVLFSFGELNVDDPISIISPEDHESYWAATLIWRNLGDLEYLDKLSDEIDRVGNEEFLPDCESYQHNFHWSAAYQEILLEQLFLAPAGDEDLQNKKRDILKKALTLKSKKLRALAQFYLDLNYFAGLEHGHGMQESELLFSYIKNRARNITTQYRTSSVAADYTEFARVDKVKEYGKHFCILALKGAIDNHTQLNLEVLRRHCGSKTEFEEIIIREIREAWLAGKIEDILIFEENHLLFFDHPLLSKLRRLKEINFKLRARLQEEISLITQRRFASFEEAVNFFFKQFLRNKKVKAFSPLSNLAIFIQDYYSYFEALRDHHPIIELSGNFIAEEESWKNFPTLFFIFASFYSLCRPEAARVSGPIIMERYWYDSYWAWVLSSSLHGGKNALEDLDAELKKVQDECFVEKSERPNDHFWEDKNNHWSVAYQEILLEAIYLAPATSRDQQELKERILREACEMKSPHGAKLARYYLETNNFSGEEHFADRHLILQLYVGDRFSHEGDYTNGVFVDKINLVQNASRGKAALITDIINQAANSFISGLQRINLQLAPQAANLEQALVVLNHLVKKCKELEIEIDRGQTQLINNLTQQLLMLLNSNPDCFLGASEYLLTDSLEILSQQLLVLVEKYPKLLQEIKPVSIIERFRSEFGTRLVRQLVPKVAQGFSSSEIAIPDDDVSLEIPEKRMLGRAEGDEAAIQSFLSRMPIYEAKIPIITSDGGIAFVSIIDYLKYLEQKSLLTGGISSFYQTQKLDRIVKPRTADQIDVTYNLNPSADGFCIFPLTPFSRVVCYTAKGNRKVEIRRTPWGTTEVKYQGKASLTLRIELTDQPFVHPSYQRFREILVQAAENFTLPLWELDPDLQNIVEQARAGLDDNFDMALNLLIAADRENNLYTTSASIRLGYKLYTGKALFLAFGLGIGNCDDLSRKRAALLLTASIPCLIYQGLVPKNSAESCGIYTPWHTQVAVFGRAEIIISDPTVRTKSVDPKNSDIDFGVDNLRNQPAAIFQLGRGIRKELDSGGLTEPQSSDHHHQFSDQTNANNVIKYLALCVNHINNISNNTDETRLRGEIYRNVQLLELMFDNGNYERQAWDLGIHGAFISTIVEFLYQAENYFTQPLFIAKTRTTLTKYLSLLPELIDIKHFESVISSDKNNVCLPKVVKELNQRITTEVKDSREKIRYRIEILKAIKEAIDLNSNQLRISESLLDILYLLSRELGSDVVISNETELINSIKESLRALRDFTPNDVDKKLYLIRLFLQGFSNCSREIQDRLLEEADFRNCFKREVDGSLSLPAAFQEQLFSLLDEDYCANKRFRYVSMFSEFSFFKLTAEQKKKLSEEVSKDRARHRFFLNRPNSDHPISSLLFYLMAKAPQGMQANEFISIVCLYNKSFLDDSIFVTAEAQEENPSYRREEDLACDYFDLASSNQNKPQMLKMGDFNCNFQVEFFAQLIFFYHEREENAYDEWPEPLINLAKLQGVNQTICSLLESFAEQYPIFFHEYVTEVMVWAEIMGSDLLKEILLEHYLHQSEENKIKYSLYCMVQTNDLFETAGFVRTQKFDSLVTNGEFVFFLSVDPGFAPDGDRNGVVFSSDLQSRISKSQFPDRKNKYFSMNTHGLRLADDFFYIRLAGFAPVNKDDQGKTISANHPGDIGHVEARVIFPILNRRLEAAAKKLDEEHQRINRNANLTPMAALRLIARTSSDGTALNIRGVIPNDQTFELRGFAPDADRRLLSRKPDHRLSPPLKSVIQKETASPSMGVPAVISVGNVDNGLVAYEEIPRGAVLPIPTLVRVPPVISAGNVNNVLVLDAEYLPEQEEGVVRDKVFLNLEKIYLLLLSHVNEARKHGRDPLKYLPELHIYARGICLQKFDKQFFQQLMTSTDMSKQLLMHLWSIGIFWQYFLEEEGRCQDQMIFPEFPLLQSDELVGSLDRQLKYRIMLFLSKKHRTKTRQNLAGKINNLSLLCPD